MSTYAVACNIFIIVAWTALVSWWWVHYCLREYRWIRSWVKEDARLSAKRDRLFWERIRITDAAFARVAERLREVEKKVTDLEVRL